MFRLWDGRDRGNILCKEYGEYSIEFVQSAITFGAIPGRSSCAIPWVVELCNTKGGIVCNRIGSTERAASSAYHGIGAWGGEEATDILAIEIHSAPVLLPPSPPPHLSGCRYQALSGTISCPSTQEQDGTWIYLLAAISGSVFFCIKAAKLE